jgi:hypothetical protein
MKRGLLIGLMLMLGACQRPTRKSLEVTHEPVTTVIACYGTKVETLPAIWKINGHYRYLPKNR